MQERNDKPLELESVLAFPTAFPIKIMGRREAGFTNLTLSFGWEKPADYLRKLEWLAAKVLPLLP